MYIYIYMYIYLSLYIYIYTNYELDGYRVWGAEVVLGFTPFIRRHLI